MTGYETVDCDVLVVGAGAAGLRAAIAASAHGARTAVACKSLLGKAATVLDRDGLAAALGNGHARDGWRRHFRDTMQVGGLRADWRMALLHAQDAPARVLELEEWGALVDRTPDQRILQRAAAGHRHPRLVQAGERSGLEVLRTLQHRAGGSVALHMECALHRILVAGGRACGAIGYRRASGVPVLFRSRAVVLATGGGDRLWQGDAAADSTGDGFALALDAGAALVDMERPSSGGVRIDADSTSTDVLGLFAAGDLAAGLHGEQRIAGNALSAALVFGQRAGLHAARHAAGAAPGMASLDWIEGCIRDMRMPVVGEESENPYGLLRELRECLRVAPSLAAIRDIARRQADIAVPRVAAFNPAWHLALELRSLTLLAEATLLAADERGRAATHELVLLRRCNGALVASREAAPPIPAEYRRLIDWSKAWPNRKPASASGAAMPAAARSATTA